MTDLQKPCEEEGGGEGSVLMISGISPIQAGREGQTGRKREREEKGKGGST